jgi:ATP-dependent 26S proteasome regulatory subunit
MQAYVDSLAHLQEELHRLDGMLRLHFEGLGADSETSKDGFEGMYISAEDISRLLEPTQERQPQANEQLRQQIDDQATRLRERVSVSYQQGIPIRFAALADNFALSRPELDALLLALAPELDQKYEQIFAYLLDDITSKRPTVGLILRVLSHTEQERLSSLSYFSSSSPLLEHGLVTLHPDSQDVPKLSRSVSVDRHIVEYLTGTDDIAGSLAAFARLEESNRAATDLTLEAETRARLDSLVSDATHEPTLYYLHGPPGSGRAGAANAIAASIGLPRLVVDTASLAGKPLDEVLARLKREAMLKSACLQFENVGALDDHEDTSIDTLVARLETFDRHVFLTGADPWTPTQKLPTHEFASLAVERPSFPLRKTIWDEYAEQLPDDIDPESLASKFSLTRGQIEDALFTARAFTNGNGLTASAVYKGCRAQSSAELEELAQKAETTYGWNDIVLPDDKTQQLREVEAHVQHRGTVYSDWGFEEKFSLGNGLIVLFTGPSGTGKTMAAEIIAANAGLDLYKIDIASVISKYIGETEKNLGKIFDEAAHSNAILLFDEADALFGQRSEVSDAQDRYANVEVNYLLQRVEEHDGTVILTTNFEQNIDDAFQRRLNVSIDFPRPSEDSRRAIWDQIFPADTPVGDLDYEFLSTFEVTGGNIKNIAQTAAFLAADDTGTVEMKHVVMATKLELQKVGKLVNPSDFGTYQDLLAR